MRWSGFLSVLLTDSPVSNVGLDLKAYEDETLRVDLILS